MLTSQSALRKDRRTAPVKMQHRHFATIATIIRGIPRDLDGHTYRRQEVAEHFAAQLARTNPNFDKARFIAACQQEA